MKVDPGILQAVLFSAAKRKPSLLPAYDQAEINKHKRLLLEHELASGDETTRPDLEKRAAASSCSIDSLTDDGENLLNLSSNETAWARAKEAYVEEAYSWSLSEFHAFLKNQVHRQKHTARSVIQACQLLPNLKLPPKVNGW